MAEKEISQKSYAPTTPQEIVTILVKYINARGQDGWDQDYVSIQIQILAKMLEVCIHCGRRNTIDG
jgi:hypothetical protein